MRKEKKEERFFQIPAVNKSGAAGFPVTVAYSSEDERSTKDRKSRKQIMRYLYTQKNCCAINFRVVYG
ncbi:MAG: hypothetical protein A3D96_04585 [Chlamydiae bacterium RIFCSPHIGHO2_12_FULL_44_59]|nr:MAG: hypothetical protein A2796_04360 [Chlamydiae bacterium RIFCSPHIGHO2_01_FULL_44_39]OGN60365.1 MAG: hypothetical protein A3D96_04585 [Chlamydiae bacterium RIFCSPHIGHO2_12_FULL_44_59]OGN66348.1 MAG: hypothetical protein A2978_02030 [Chlamydiae bacterium RIFCSPLOWO2_01_FULL_44_52]OGN69299.1 MAG: hypothetical protein A3I67_00890 [Chlamydiae bacterium RIFCSPLOWO2_02_FULL_45_22]OGN70239.1 MAG: hypothetical protein A3F79_01175 [Chlamydiae bacterium RIFCSPLOWO2_12_FULL_45_20]